MLFLINELGVSVLSISVKKQIMNFMVSKY